MVDKRVQRDARSQPDRRHFLSHGCDNWLGEGVLVGVIATVSREVPDKRKVPSFFAFFSRPKHLRSFDRFLRSAYSQFRRSSGRRWLAGRLDWEFFDDSGIESSSEWKCPTNHFSPRLRSGRHFPGRRLVLAGCPPVGRFGAEFCVGKWPSAVNGPQSRRSGSGYFFGLRLSFACHRVRLTQSHLSQPLRDVTTHEPAHASFR